MIPMIAAMIIYDKYEKKGLPRWVLFGLAGAVIGFALMVIAPGNYVRYEQSVEEGGKSISLILYFERFLSSLSMLYFFSLALVFIFSLLAVLYRYYGIKENKRTAIYGSRLFFAGAFIAAAVMTASPIFPVRTMFGINMFFVVSIGILYACLDFKAGIIKNISRLSVFFALLFFIPSYLTAFKEIKNADRVLSERMEILEKGKQEGQKDFIFTGEIIHKPSTIYFHYYELPDDTTDWHNLTFSRFYDINSVRVIKKEDKNY